MYQRVIAFNDQEINAYIEVFLPIFTASDDPFEILNTRIDHKTFQATINGIHYRFPSKLIQMKVHQIVVEEDVLSNLFLKYNFNLQMTETKNVFFNTKLNASKAFERFYLLEAFNVHYQSLFSANDFNPELISVINNRQSNLQYEAAEAFSYYRLNISDMFPNFNSYYFQVKKESQLNYLNELYKQALSLLSGGLEYEKACHWALINKNYSKTGGLI